MCFKNPPLVSILIPSYNSQNSIVDTLDSCLNQSYKNIEIIVVDDGSSDNTCSILNSYSTKDSRVKYYTQKNSGAQRARNYAFEMSRGEYIQYLDSDDKISPTKIYDSVNILENHNKFDICFSRLFFWYPNSNELILSGKSIYKDYDRGYDWLLDSWGGGGISQTSMWFFSRELHLESGSWHEGLKKNQDGEFFTRVLLNSQKVIFESSSYISYRQENPSAISKKNDIDSLKSVIYSLNLIKDSLNNKKLLTFSAKYALSKKYIHVLMFYSLSNRVPMNELLTEIKLLNKDYKKLIPNKIIKYFSFFIGIKLTLKIRSYIYVLRNSFEK